MPDNPDALEAYDADRVRGAFSALSHGSAHFDSPGGTQTPDVVAAAIAGALTAPLSNRGELYPAARNAGALVHGFRAAMGDLLGVDPGTVVHGRSMTALTFDLARTLASTWSPGEEIVVSSLDHDANVRPWVIAAERAGVTVRWAELDPETGELPVEAVTGLLGERTRLVALTAASNLIGTRPDVAAVAAETRRAGALLHVDGVHHTAHALVDVPALGADLYSCSPYKFLGPHCGVLTGRADLLEQLRPDKLVPSSDAVPERFEQGTLPYEQLAGVTAAVDFLADLVPGGGSRRERLARSMTALHGHESRLARRLEEGVLALPGVTLWSRAERRTPTMLMTFEGLQPLEVSRALAERGVVAPAGTFYAVEPARRLGLHPTGAVRVGLAPYSTDDDVDRLLEGLDFVVRDRVR